MDRANWAVARFPFDPNLRHMRYWIRSEIKKEEAKPNAIGK